ncbi:MAG: phosphoribosylanthranilate isomerase [Anaerolineae bacterium]|nr:phosphoribosylanthranilate isomerase [Anaerolineae bacterium]
MIVQIYGVTTVEDGIAVAKLGAERIGLVLCEDERLTHDGVSNAEAQAIMAALPPHVVVTGLTFSTDADEIEEQMRTVKPHVLHLTVTPDLFPIAAIRRLKAKLPGIEVMQAIPVSGPEAVEQALLFEEVAEVIMLDTPRAGGHAIGATGKTHDWSISRKVVEACKRPVILAGGLSAANVAEAIRTVRPWGVDSSTLTSNPANMKRKDLERTRAFIEAAKQAK